jgi:integrase
MTTKKGSSDTNERRPKHANGEGGYRQRPNGLWECRFTLSNGKRKSIYGASFEECRTNRKQAEREQERGLDLSARRQTVEAFLIDWLENVARPRVRSSTHTRYVGYVRGQIIPALGRHQLDKLTPQHIQAFLNERSKTGLAPRTVQYFRAILRSALDQALRWGLVSRNVATLAEPPRSVHKQIDPLSPAETRAFLAATESDRLGPLYRVAILTGLRQGELLGLRWQDIDLTNSVLAVRNALQRIDGMPVLVEPKTARSRRTITLPVGAVEALKEQRRRQAEDRLASSVRWQDWGLVFASSVGTPLDASNVTHRLQRVLADAGLPRQRFHDLRHLCATLLLSQGVSARVVMEQLGHSQIGLTMNTYAHVMPSMLREAANALDAALSEDQSA